MIITQINLHNFYAELWNSAEQTCGNSRYLYALNCWLIKDYKTLPNYMKEEYKRGRVIIYPLFPEYCYKDMEYKKE